MMPKRDISQKRQWLGLLKLPQKMWLGTHRPLSLLNSYMSYPKSLLPSLPSGEYQMISNTAPLATESRQEIIPSCILE